MHSSKDVMEPLLFEPYFSPKIWGARHLEEQLGKRLPDEEKYGESWELSAHCRHVSVVAEGPHRGTALTELWRQSGPQLLGRSVPAEESFPLLIKLLDCDDFISVQVHPQEKTEAWVVLDAEPTARIYAGLKPGITRDELNRHLKAGTVPQCLHGFTPRPGDCVFLPAGTVHSCGGVLLAEIQQPSDVVYRFFDWNRRNAQGEPLRTLDGEEGFQFIDWTIGPVDPVSSTELSADSAVCFSERLVHCRHFQIDRHCPRAEFSNPYPERLSIWMVLDGAVELYQSGSGYRRRLRRGETVLVPAAGFQVNWIPAADCPPVLLAVTAPPSP